MALKKKNIILEKTYDFSLRIVKMYQHLVSEHKEYVLTKQLLRSGTSIGANTAEAHGGISDADFSAKISIAYKESLETKFWIELLFDAGYITEKSFQSIYDDCDEISRILYSILKKHNRTNSSNK
jgi:four helix bundle protein